MTLSLPRTVDPGELIRAEFMNQVLAALTSLDNRLTTLEVVQPATSAVVITNIIPNGPVRVNEQIEIIGRSFALSAGALRLFIDGIRITELLTGSGDEHLVFRVPAVPNVPDSGKAVMLSVSNQTTTENRTLVVLPQQIALLGNLDVNFQSATPAMITVNQPATFRYKLKSRANATTQFTIQATVSGVPNASDWNNVITILNDDDSPNSSKGLSLAPEQEKFFKVRIASVPGTPAAATFILTATGIATGITATPDTRSFTVGQPAEQQDQKIDLAFFTSLPPNVVSGGVIRLAAGGIARLTLAAQFHEGGSFTVSQGVTSGTGWTVERLASTTPETIPIDPGEVANAQGFAPRSLDFIVRADASSSSSGQAFFRLQKGPAAVPRTLALQLGRPT